MFGITLTLVAAAINAFRNMIKFADDAISSVWQWAEGKTEPKRIKYSTCPFFDTLLVSPEADTSPRQPYGLLSYNYGYTASGSKTRMAYDLLAACTISPNNQG